MDFLANFWQSNPNKSIGSDQSQRIRRMRDDKRWLFSRLPKGSIAKPG
jgi:hypothetical protein